MRNIKLCDKCKHKHILAEKYWCKLDMTLVFKNPIFDVERMHDNKKDFKPPFRCPYILEHTVTNNENKEQIEKKFKNM